MVNVWSRVNLAVCSNTLYFPCDVGLLGQFVYYLVAFLIGFLGRIFAHLRVELSGSLI